jgi:hypothetical protein
VNFFDAFDPAESETWIVTRKEPETVGEPSTVPSSEKLKPLGIAAARGDRSAKKYEFPGVSARKGFRFSYERRFRGVTEMYILPIREGNCRKRHADKRKNAQKHRYKKQQNLEITSRCLFHFS